MIRYVKTAFGTRFQSIEEEREMKLSMNGTLSQEPWLEPLPIYVSSHKKINDLSDEDLPNMKEDEIRIFKGLVQCGLFRSDIELYQHQLNMLKTSLAGRNCVITAGTGSGKTESFLLPLFAQIAREIPRWKRPLGSCDGVDSWWNDRKWQEECKRWNCPTTNEHAACPQG